MCENEKGKTNWNMKEEELGNAGSRCFVVSETLSPSQGMMVQSKAMLFGGG